MWFGELSSFIICYYLFIIIYRVIFRTLLCFMINVVADICDIKYHEYKSVVEKFNNC